VGGTEISDSLVYGLTVIPVALCLGIFGFIGLFTMEKLKDRQELNTLTSV